MANAGNHFAPGVHAPVEGAGMCGSCHINVCAWIPKIVRNLYFGAVAWPNVLPKLFASVLARGEKYALVCCYFGSDDAKVIVCCVGGCYKFVEVVGTGSSEDEVVR